MITSDESPKALTLLEPRLQSRFSLWLVTDIKAPDVETRVAILQAKAQKKDATIEQRHMEIIAESVFTNVRELEGALNIVMTKQQLLKRELTDQDIFDSLDTLGIQDVRQPGSTLAATQTNVISPPPLDQTGTPPDKGVNASTVALGGLRNQAIPNTSVSAYEKKLSNIATYYGLEIESIKGNRRTKEISYARQCAMYIAKTQFNRSLQKIGNYFGGKNHSSVIYAIKTFEKSMKSDGQVKEIVRNF